jgi:RNA polymerase sigma factor (sigma-70 family)
MTLYPKGTLRMDPESIPIELNLTALASLRSALLSFVRRRVATAAEAEDLVQEAFARLYAATAANPIGEPQAYLFRIAANLIIDHGRRSGSALGQAEHYEEAFAPSVAANQDLGIRQEELQILFERALAELPDRRRQVFILARFEERSTLAIALQLRITRRMVQKHLILATSHLYDRLRPHMEDVL